MIYTVTFNPSVDCILHIGDVKFGGLNRASKEEFFFSGKGINVSTVLHRLGAATSAITFVGGFTGSETERVLSPDVPLDVIRLAEGCTRINVKLKAPDGSETEINAPGAPIGEDGMRKLYARLSVLGSGDTLVLSGSVPSDVGTNVYSEIFASLEGRGVRFCADAAGALLRGALSRGLFVIKPNVAELEETLGRSVNGEAEICRAARELQRMGSEYVLVTAGADGAYLFAPGTEHITHRFRRVRSLQRSARETARSADFSADLIPDSARRNLFALPPPAALPRRAPYGLHPAKRSRRRSAWSRCTSFDTA